MLVSIAVRLAGSRVDPSLRLGAAGGALAATLLGAIWFAERPRRSRLGGEGRHARVAAQAQHRPDGCDEDDTLERTASRRSTPRLAGTVAEGRDANGLIDVHLDSTLRGRVRGQLKLVLQGVPLDDGGVSMTASGVDFAARGTPLYQGQIVALDGNRVTARVADGAGHALTLALVLQLSHSSNALQRDTPREPGVSAALGHLDARAAAAPRGARRPALGATARAPWRVTAGSSSSAASSCASSRRAGFRAAGERAFRSPARSGRWPNAVVRPVVVVNAAEGEPTSGKDKLLLRHLPHLVIDGAVALARELGAREAIIVHSADAGHAGDALCAAIKDRSARRFDGGREIDVVELPAGFVRGQEGAIVQYLNGGPALPTVMPPRPFESGVEGRPTLIQNAETVAHVALIGRYGAGWFRELGTPAEPGSALFTVSGAIGRPGVYEAAVGVRLKDLVAIAGGVTGAPRAFLVGGYACAWIGAADAAKLTLDEASLRTHGGSLGVGAVTVLPADACGICETARVARYLAHQSAGQCGPCVHGLDAVAAALEHPRPDRPRIERWLGHVAGRGACHHPDGTARFVASALKVFADDLPAHDHARCGRGRKRVLPTTKP